jgi:hypothetical protein
MSNLDRVVDAALRRMVAGAGPPDLRARVMARLDEPARPRPPRWIALAAAAGIAVAVAGVALLRIAPGREPIPATGPPPASTRPAAPTAAAVAGATRPPVPTVPPAPAHARPRRAEPPPAEGAPFDLDAGMDVEPIEVAPLAVAPISGERIAVNALTIERMEIEPLAEPQP